MAVLERNEILKTFGCRGLKNPRDTLHIIQSFWLWDTSIHFSTYFRISSEHPSTRFPLSFHLLVLWVHLLSPHLATCPAHHHLFPLTASIVSVTPAASLKFIALSTVFESKKRSSLFTFFFKGRHLLIFLRRGGCNVRPPQALGFDQLHNHAFPKTGICTDGEKVSNKIYSKLDFLLKSSHKIFRISESIFAGNWGYNVQSLLTFLTVSV